MPKADISERAKKLIGGLFEAMTDTAGTPGVPYDKLQELVVADPEAAAFAVPILLKAAERDRGLYQLAQAIAGAYEVETKDDSLTKMVDGVVSKLAKPLKPIRFVDATASPGTPSVTSVPAQPNIGIFAVDPGDLAKGDVFPLVRLFRVDEKRIDKDLTRGLRGKIIMTFPVDDDPRPVWQIPSVRTHQQKLFAQVPYFPYYLDPNPPIGMFLTFFAPLADLSAVNKDGVNLGDPSVVDKVVASMKAVARLAELVGESPAEVCRSILQAAPADFAAIVLKRAKL